MSMDKKNTLRFFQRIILFLDTYDFAFALLLLLASLAEWIRWIIGLIGLDGLIIFKLPFDGLDGIDPTQPFFL